MAPPIDRIDAKVQRAKKHVEDFQIALREFVQTNPHAVMFKADAQTDGRRWWAEHAKRALGLGPR